MASSTLGAMMPSRQSRARKGLVVAGAVFVVVAAAWAFGRGGDEGPQSAFAQAPGGNYLVLARPSEDRLSEVISVAPASDPAAAMDIATVATLEGYGSSGSVSPDGSKLALVTPDAGTRSRPGSSLLVVDLLTGEVTRLAIAVDILQRPAWTPDGAAVVVTRTVQGDGAPSEVTVHRVPLDLSGEQVLESHGAVLGAYVVGFDPAGRLVTVVIDGGGSRLFRDGAELLSLGTNITRDWALSPDGSALAYIETDLSAGVAYRSRIVALDGSGGAAAQEAAEGQALGAAWSPDGVADLGREGVVVGPSAQEAAPAGFDIPKGFAPDGSAQVVQHWSGATFAEPGDPALELVAGNARLALPARADFLGWAVR